MFFEILPFARGGWRGFNETYKQNLPYPLLAKEGIT